MGSVRREIVIELCDHGIEWGSVAMIIPEHVPNARERLVAFVAQELSRLLQDTPASIAIQATRSFIGKPLLVGRMWVSGRQLRICGQVEWAQENNRFEGSLTLNTVKTADQERADLVKKLRSRDWHLKPWVNEPAIVSRGDSARKITKFTGQAYDPDKWSLEVDFWDHEHCALCWAKIADEGVAGRDFSEGYTDGEQWLCPPCYDVYIAREHRGEHEPLS